MNDLSKRIANLPPEKRAELLRRLEQAGNKVSRPSNRVREPGRPLPLSFSQQRLWLLYELQPTSAAYNLPNLLRIQGRLDTELLERALRTVIERHENRAIVEVNQKRYHLHKAQAHEANFDVTVELPHEFWVID